MGYTVAATVLFPLTSTTGHCLYLSGSLPDPAVLLPSLIFFAISTRTQWANDSDDATARVAVESAVSSVGLGNIQFPPDYAQVICLSDCSLKQWLFVYFGSAICSSQALLSVVACYYLLLSILLPLTTNGNGMVMIV